MHFKLYNREIRTDLSHFSFRDYEVTKGQMRGRNFSTDLICAVACRCRWGFPQVLCCRPFFHGLPFPTTFWLCCPYLGYKCGVLESMGGVGELERYLSGRIEEYRIYNVAYALYRISLLAPIEKKFLTLNNIKFLTSLRKNGIGGIRTTSKATVKCLHLQVGSMLALRPHPAEMWLHDKIKKMSCDDVRCAAFVRR